MNYGIQSDPCLGKFLSKRVAEVVREEACSTTRQDYRALWMDCAPHSQFYLEEEICGIGAIEPSRVFFRQDRHLVVCAGNYPAAFITHTRAHPHNFLSQTI